MSWLRRINDAIDEIVDYRALVPLRIAAGPQRGFQLPRQRSGVHLDSLH